MTYNDMFKDELNNEWQEDQLLENQQYDEDFEDTIFALRNLPENNF